MAFDKHTIQMLKGSDNTSLDMEIIGKKTISHYGASAAISSVTVTSMGLSNSVMTLTLTGPGSGAVLVPHMRVAAVGVLTSGVEYGPGDVLTVTGGTFTTAAQFTVAAVNGGGGITSVTLTTPGSYTVLPTGPIVATGGTGNSAQFLVNWGLASVSVSNGGTGYDSSSGLTVSGGATASLVINNVGNTLTLPITDFTDLPDSYCVLVNPGQNCRWYVPQSSKTNSEFDVVLVPVTSSDSIAAGDLDVFISA